MWLGRTDARFGKAEAMAEDGSVGIGINGVLRARSHFFSGNRLLRKVSQLARNER